MIHQERLFTCSSNHEFKSEFFLQSQTLGRLAAAQRATVRALRMLINSAPLQPKRSQHYPSIYQALTSLIQQLSLLAIQIEGGDDGVTKQVHSGMPVRHNWNR